MLPLATARLMLRELRLGDARAITALVGNWNVARWLALLPYPYRLKDAESFIVYARGSHASSADMIAAILHDDGLIGVVSIESRPQGPELGYWLGEPYWGHGYMSEAADGLVAAYFRATDAAELRSGYFEGNTGSARVLAKLGFETTGRGRLFSLPNRRELPDIEMTLTQSRFRTLHS